MSGEKLSRGAARPYRDQDAQPLTVKGVTKTQEQADAAALGHKLKRTSGVTLAITLEATEDRTLVVEIAVGDPIVGRPFSARLKSAIGDLL